jgi:hypothetical protein
MGVNNNFDSNKLSNASTSEWEKMEQMKYVEQIRQLKKQELIDSVSKNVEVKEKRILNVVSGECYIFEVDFSNTIE